MKRKFWFIVMFAVMFVGVTGVTPVAEDVLGGTVAEAYNGDSGAMITRSGFNAMKNRLFYYSVKVNKYGDGLRVRKEPSTSSTALTALPKGTHIHLTSNTRTYQGWQWQFAAGRNSKGKYFKGWVATNNVKKNRQSTIDSTGRSAPYW